MKKFVHCIKLWNLVIVVSCSIAFLSTENAFADNFVLDVSPLGGNFGDVAVGNSGTITFIFSNLGPEDLWIYRIALTDSTNINDPNTNIVTPYSIGTDPNPNHHGEEYELGAFAFDYTDFIWSSEPPIVKLVGELVTVDLIFTPLSPGYYQAFLFVQSNDDSNPGPQAYFPLQGMGVEAAIPEPASLLLLGTGLSVIAVLARRSR